MAQYVDMTRVGYGCVIDRSQGGNIDREVALLAQSLGWQVEWEVEDDDELGLEEWHFLGDEALDWLNDNDMDADAYWYLHDNSLYHDADTEGWLG